MSDKEKLKFTKTITKSENENPQQTAEHIRRQRIKENLIKKFNLSEDEAEEKLRELEGKSWNKTPARSPKNENNNLKQQKTTLRRPKNYTDSETIIPQHVLDRQKDGVKQGKQKQQKKQPQKQTPQQKPKQQKTQPKQQPTKEQPQQKQKQQKTQPKQQPTKEQPQQKQKQQKKQPKQQPTKEQPQQKQKQKQQKKQPKQEKPQKIEQPQKQTPQQKPKQHKKQPKQEKPQKIEQPPKKQPPIEQKQPKQEKPQKIEQPPIEQKQPKQEKPQKIEQPPIEQKQPKQEKPTPQEKISAEEEYLKDFTNQDTQKKAKKSRFSKLFNRKKKEEEIKQPEPLKIEENNQDIDAILGDIVPNYSQEVSIELKDVNLSFQVYEDQIDNLKEQVIRTLKRNKSKAKTVHVLKDISFKIYQGEKVGVIGYNAAGKSTLLKLIVGSYTADSGTVIANGKISPLLTLGAGFDNNFSGAKNIYLNGAILGYDREFIESKYDEIVEFADIGESINYPIRNYSSGMKAKLGFSIATIVDPDILIIDEILGVGDINFKRKSKDKMKSLMGGKTTVLLVSHSIGQIRDICDKAIWIDQGRVREIGEVNEVCDHYEKDSKKATKEQLKNIQFN
ncbi:MAG: ATP-binding cassette domain-containing protein [Methanobrevibacter sp.]|uniref:ATP-binding cassette domain-containing protein n=1 Tax=Methanobrevibacter sp. TaxID=66852 RepID=UPI0025D5F5B8|nr:ATP-binding cassette domain-containing protein [Methanobrevibacter sp.]MBR6994162.1 ATP-binding cassette domain-containing protein [Methanobrevibacter sp.]